MPNLQLGHQLNLAGTPIVQNTCGEGGSPEGELFSLQPVAGNTNWFNIITSSGKCAEIPSNLDDPDVWVYPQLQASSVLGSDNGN
jgi:hypothetical protein